MLHSVVIPHRDRNGHLGLCLWSLQRSARACGIAAWEAVVVDLGSRDAPCGDLPNLVLVSEPVRSDPFNRARALNLGILRAGGELLTFLDADAIVGERFMEAALCLEDASLDRCCYRVRYLPLGEDVHLRAAEDREAYARALFAEYDGYRMALECYGASNRDIRRARSAQPVGQPWGNSQFSIRREKLGETRFDEEIGCGLEDMDMNLHLEVKFGGGYRGRIFTDPAHAVFHLEHPDRYWQKDDVFLPRKAIYRKKRARLLAGQAGGRGP